MNSTVIPVLTTIWKLLNKFITISGYYLVLTSWRFNIFSWKLVCCSSCKHAEDQTLVLCKHGKFLLRALEMFKRWYFLFKHWYFLYKRWYFLFKRWYFLSKIMWPSSLKAAECKINSVNSDLAICWSKSWYFYIFFKNCVPELRVFDPQRFWKFSKQNSLQFQALV